MMFTFCGLTTTHYYGGCCEPSNWCSIGHLFLWETIEKSKMRLKRQHHFKSRFRLIKFNSRSWYIRPFRFMKHILFWYEGVKLIIYFWLLYRRTFLISFSRYYCFFTPTTLGKPIRQCIHNLYRSWETK